MDVFAAIHDDEKVTFVTFLHDNFAFSLERVEFLDVCEVYVCGVVCVVVILYVLIDCFGCFGDVSMDLCECEWVCAFFVEVWCLLVVDPFFVYV